MVLVTGATIGLCILGDSFLYGNLPLEAGNLGIALPLVGVLLSANRLVRLASNTLASGVFARWGARKPFALATVISFGMTAAYGLGWGFAVFLCARLGWGIAWSALRQGGYQAVWTATESDRGKLTGLLWGLIRLGSAIGVVSGGFLRDRLGYPWAVGGIAVATLFALPLALSIPWRDATRARVPARQSSLGAWRDALANRRERGLLLLGLVDSAVEAILVSTVALYVANRIGALDLFGMQAGTLAGLLLAVRWTSDLLFGPFIGAFSDRFGRARLLALLAGLLCATMFGLALFSGVGLLLCLLLVFLNSAGLVVTLSAVANRVALESRYPHHFVGAYSTAIDAGAAAGPLIAYSLAGAIALDWLYGAAGVILVGAVLGYLALEKK